MMDILDDDEQAQFSINKDYANRYDRWRQKEELQKLKAKYGDESDSSSTSESEDENAEALTPQLEKDWLRTLAALKSKDPKIYNKNYKFYQKSSSSSPSDESSSDENEKETKQDKKKEKPMFLKDYERKVILEKGGVLSESESEDNEKKPPGYYEEQELIKKSIKSLVGDDSDSDSELLTKRTKTKEELEKEEEDYLQWLKGQKEELEGDSKVGIELNPLKDYWNNPSLSADEKFLRDYILNKGYKDENTDEIPTYDEIVNDGEGALLDLSEDEEEMEREELFEHKYNFRFEDPDPDFIKSYPRTIENSLRRKDTHRTEKRQEIKERKKQEKARKMEELKQLRNLKKKEVFDKIEKIKQVAGNTSLGVSEEDLEEDFDPAKHDQMMQKMFSDDYYGEEEDLEKPTWEEDDGDLATEDWDAWTGEEPKAVTENTASDMKNEEHYDEDEADSQGHFIMDADYDPSQDVPTKKRRRKSKFAQAVTKKKPVFNPDEATFEEYFNEFYKLDYEDVIADQPCRFKYRQVQPNDFGLSTEEVLNAREKELNQWVSVKKMVQYRTAEEEKIDCMIFRRKGGNVKKKMQILTSLAEKDEEEETEEEPKKKKRKKRKKGKGNERAEEDDDSMKALKRKADNESSSGECAVKKLKHSERETLKTDQVQTQLSTETNIHTKSGIRKEDSGEDSLVQEGRLKTTDNKNDNRTDNDMAENKKRKKNKKKKASYAHVNIVSDERLKAYGINPKKIKYTHPHIKTDLSGKGK